MNAPAPYRRAILGIGSGGIDRRMLRAAAEFARLLELEVLGIFVEDQSVLGLASLPFVRELRLPGHDWQTLDPQRMSYELRAAAERARRLFEQEIAAQGLVCRFEVRRGGPAVFANDIGEVTDILIVAEPVATVDRLAAAVGAAQRRALALPASVLFLPSSASPQSSGPVAAVAASRADPAFLLASRIAAATGEQAVAIPPGDERSVERLSAALRRSLGGRPARLLILTRRKSEGVDDICLELAVRLSTPMLVVAPAAGNGDQAAAAAG